MFTDDRRFSLVLSRGQSRPVEGAGEQPRRLHAGMPPRLLVLARSLIYAQPLAEALVSAELEVTADTPADFDVAAHGPVDLVIVRCVGGDLTPLAGALALREPLACPQYVFVADDRSDSAAAALAAIGVKELLGSAEAAAWIRGAAAALVEVVRARRALRRASQQIPELPPCSAGFAGNGRGLFEAELRFREAYVRVLVSQIPVRTEAAARARVPYRTFSEILRKLGIARTR